MATNTSRLKAIKVEVDLVCVYNVGMFEFKDGFGYLEHVTVCQFLGSLFGELFSFELGFVSEEELEKGEEIQLQNEDLGLDSSSKDFGLILLPLLAF